MKCSHILRKETTGVKPFPELVHHPQSDNLSQFTSDDEEGAVGGLGTAKSRKSGKNIF